MKKTPQKTPKIKLVLLALAAVAVFGGSILFVGAASGWFSGQEIPVKVVLDPEYLGQYETKSLDKTTYESLVEAKKSFIIISYLPGCTAKILSFTSKFASENNITIYYMDFGTLKTTPLHDQVKYSPSVIIISKGEIADFLRSDKDEDTPKYNNYDDFSAWLQGKIDFSAQK